MKNLFSPEKKVKMSFVGLNGNAFVLMGSFQREAKKQGWSSEEIAKVLGECRSADYHHLLQVLMEHTIDPENEED